MLAPCERVRSGLPALETRSPFQGIFSRAADTRLLYSIPSSRSVSTQINARADNWFGFGRNPAVFEPCRRGFLRRSLSKP